MGSFLCLLPYDHRCQLRLPTYVVTTCSLPGCNLPTLEGELFSFGKQTFQLVESLLSKAGTDRLCDIFAPGIERRIEVEKL